MKKWAVAAGCAAVAAVVLYVTFFRASDEDRIRGVLDRLAKAVAVKRDDNAIARAARVKSELKELVTDDVRADVSELRVGVTGRAKLVEDATKLGLVYQEASVSFTNAVIKIDDAKTTAKADVTGVVTATSGGERKTDKRDVHFLLRKEDGAWRVTTIDVMEPRTE
jgi:hypothetical protein